MEKKSYFTIEEICRSSVAKQHNINNVPDEPEILNNINYLIENLDALREAWGASVIVSSGYRCPELNKLVGGSKTSSHQTGFAADIQPKSMDDFDKFSAFCREYFKHHDFDQLILEQVGNSKWIHISFDPKNRKQFLKTNNGKQYQIWNQE